MDSVKTDAKWKLVPVEPTPEMIEAGDVANPTAWNEDTDLGFGCDVAFEVYRAMLAASPAAPGAEVEPVAWQWRFRAPNSDSPAAAQWSSWADGRAPELRASVYQTEERPLYTHPLDAATVRAEARREAVAEAARIVEAECKRILAQQNGRIPEVDTQLRMIALLLPDIAAAIRALADKGEAE